MDLHELNEWLKTEEGIQWLDTQKAGLVNKRDELLSALKDSNAKLAELDQRSAAAESLVKEERAALAKVMIDQGLARLLKEANIYESVIPSVTATLKETYGIQVKADGLNRLAVGKLKGDNGEEKELSLNEIIDVWRKTPEAKEVTPNLNSGGGSIPMPVSNARYSIPDLQKIQGRTLASMSDAEFQNMREQALRSAKEK